jgi:hypothetical protein
MDAFIRYYRACRAQMFYDDKGDLSEGEQLGDERSVQQQCYKVFPHLIGRI